MSEHHHESDEHAQPVHRCGNLFGCGDENGTGILREDIKDGVFTTRSADRLQHMDEVDQETLTGYLTARGRKRRQLLRASGFPGALAAVEPWFSKIAHAADGPAAGATGSRRTDQGRSHVIESNK